MKKRPGQHIDLWTLIVGNGNVNQGLARLLGATGVFIMAFGTLFWFLMS